MARKSRKTAECNVRFPISDYWEDQLKNWPGDRDQDHLGPDHAARFATVELVMKSRSLAEGEVNPVVKREQIADVVRPLDLASPGPLIDRLWEIAGRHLRPLHRLILGSDPKATVTLLRKIEKAATTLEGLVGEMPSNTREFLSEAHSRLPHHAASSVRLDLSKLEMTLGSLHLTAALAAAEFRRDHKRPPHVLKRQTLFDLVHAIETHTKAKVERRWVEKDKRVFEFKGAAGPVILDFMRLVEPKVTKRSLIKLFTEVRPKRTKN